MNAGSRRSRRTSTATRTTRRFRSTSCRSEQPRTDTVRASARRGSGEVFVSEQLIMPGSTGTNWWEAVSAPRSGRRLQPRRRGRRRGQHVRRLVQLLRSERHGGVQPVQAREHSRQHAVHPRQVQLRRELAIAAERTTAASGDPDGYARRRHHRQEHPDAAGRPGVRHRTAISRRARRWAWATRSTRSSSPTSAGTTSTSNNRIFGNVFAGYRCMPAADVPQQPRIQRRPGARSRASTRSTRRTPSRPSRTRSTRTRAQLHDWTWSNTLALLQAARQHNVPAAGPGSEPAAPTGSWRRSAISSRPIRTRGTCRTRSVTPPRRTSPAPAARARCCRSSERPTTTSPNKYVASFTLRRDGSSRLGPDHRWGTFPAFGLGWRISKESFLEDNTIFSDAMLRFGYGVTGNQQIPSGRIVSQFGGDRGRHVLRHHGIQQQRRSRVPADVAGQRGPEVGGEQVDERRRRHRAVQRQAQRRPRCLRAETNNLLFDPAAPGTAGVAAPPIVNVGKMKNTGIDFSIGHHGDDGTSTFNGSHYKNEIVSIDGVQDFFYGPITTRYRQPGHQQGRHSDRLVLRLHRGRLLQGRGRRRRATPTQDGAAPGRIKFRGRQRRRGDHLGRPHRHRQPASGLHGRTRPRIPLGGNWDVSGTRVRVVRERHLRRAEGVLRLPQLLDERAEGPAGEFVDARRTRTPSIRDWTSTTRTATRSASFYVEDGSYVRLRNLQSATTCRRRFAAGCQATRVYVQAENLFTFTGYDGSRSVAARGEHQRPRRRHPRSVPRHRSGVYPEQQNVQHRHHHVVLTMRLFKERARR